MVFMRAVHNCMKCRGVKQPDASMQTSAVMGVFQTDKHLEEKALTMIQISNSTY